MEPDRGWRDSGARRAQIAAIATVGPPLITMLARTWRWRVAGGEHDIAVRQDPARPPIMAFWHGRILSATWYFRRRGIVVMTSENFDGEWIARIIERFGYGTARGSTSRGAARALVRMRRDLAAGRPAAFTLDGPRGPALKAQPGAVWLARATGSPILPFHIEASAYWTARSWDRTQVPRPFARVGIAFGEPIDVPASTTPDGLEASRLALEATLLELKDRAEALVGPPDR